MASKDHYQRAFEAYLREKRLPYVSVDEARRALLPDGTALKLERPQPSPQPAARAPGHAGSLKSFDFVVYAPESNLLVEVKGRKVSRRRPPAPPTMGRTTGQGRFDPSLAAPARTRLESWVTLDDVDSLRTWESLFGPGFTAVFAFVFWCEEMSPSALFEEFIERDGRWYAIRCLVRADYESAMRTRSPRWRTVHVPPDSFDRLSRPLTDATGP